MNTGLTIKQAAAVSGLSVASIYNHIKAGKLVAVKQDGQTLVSKEALEAVVLRGSCPVCGEPFPKGNQRQRFCSQKCRQKANRA